jgi:hypothetical protein
MELAAMEVCASVMVATHLKRALSPGAPRDHPNSPDMKALDVIHELTMLAIEERIAAEGRAPNPTDKMSHVDTGIFHIDTVILRSSFTSILSSSISILSSSLSIPSS